MRKCGTRWRSGGLKKQSGMQRARRAHPRRVDGCPGVSGRPCLRQRVILLAILSLGHITSHRAPDNRCDHSCTLRVISRRTTSPRRPHPVHGTAHRMQSLHDHPLQSSPLGQPRPLHCTLRLPLRRTPGFTHSVRPVAPPPVSSAHTIAYHSSRCVTAPLRVPSAPLIHSPARASPSFARATRIGGERRAADPHTRSPSVRRAPLPARHRPRHSARTARRTDTRGMYT
jgi:hypothetical protein